MLFAGKLISKMNFLAHLYLSGKDPKRMVGNFMGDFVKGKEIDLLEPKISEGVRLHRLIDEFTDSHRVVSESKDRLREKYRHYAGVIVDIYYDHFLATLWQDYHPQRLEVYAEHSYQVVRSHWHLLPPKAQFMFPYMERTNWLVSYAQINGIQRAMDGMARRTRFYSKMEESTLDLQKHYSAFQSEFQLFFPDLVKFVKAEIPEIEIG